MPRRHTYMMRFRCPKCKRAGVAKWEEHGQIALPHGSQPAILKSVSDGFRAGPHDEITCTACTTRVFFGHG
jgi:DNA-directed RNA polymerase subunit RPC12/RpoP